MNEQRAPADETPPPTAPVQKPNHDADTVPWIHPDHEGSEL